MYIYDNKYIKHNMEYICNICERKFSREYNYNKHKQRKNPCIAIRRHIQQLRFIDLCAGTGAFTYSFKRNAKFKCVFSNDIDESSEKIYKLNFPNDNFTLGDINKISVEEIPAHDILCAGFPCQPFSIAGHRKGFDDERSNVFLKILEIISKHLPEIILLENVKNLKTHNKGKTYEIIEEKIKNLGYNIKSALLDTSKISGIPQHRERIYILCFRDKDKCEKFSFDYPHKENEKIIKFLEENVSEKYYYTEKLKVYEKIKNEVKKNIEDNIVYQYRRYYVRENKNNYCPTLTANMGTGGHNIPIIKDKKGIRKLTPKECFNLQGFPNEYKIPDISDNILYKLAGNAVSIPVVNLIVDQILSLF